MLPSMYCELELHILPVVNVEFSHIKTVVQFLESETSKTGTVPRNTTQLVCAPNVLQRGAEGHSIYLNFGVIFVYFYIN